MDEPAGAVAEVRRTPRQLLLAIVAFLFAIGPATAGVIRLVEHGRDVRLLAMAVVAFFAAALVISESKARERAGAELLAVAVATAVVATLVAMLSGLFFGARGIGLLLVAVVYGIWYAIAGVLYSLSRR